jgi:hypothetical protein
MHEQERQAIELACAKLINQFAVYNDAARYEELAALFTADGSYARPTDPDNYLKGRAAILAAFKGRPAEKLTRHLITNILIEVASPASAEGICYVTLYAGSTDQPAPKFGYLAAPSQLIGEYHDQFTLTAEGWKFSKRQGRLLLST